MSGHNPTRAVRDSEALDLARLQPWLVANAGWQGAVRVSQFAGGASNLTYLREGDDGQALVLRRAPPGRKAKGAHDMAPEKPAAAEDDCEPTGGILRFSHEENPLSPASGRAMGLP